jgi:hypothetical protein
MFAVVFSFLVLAAQGAGIANASPIISHQKVGSGDKIEERSLSAMEKLSAKSHRDVERLIFEVDMVSIDGVNSVSTFNQSYSPIILKSNSLRYIIKTFPCR